MIWAFIFVPLFAAWILFLCLTGLDKADEVGRFEAIGHEGGYGPVFLGFWRRPHWGIDFAFRIRFWPNHGAWNRVSLGPMFRGFRLWHRRFTFVRVCPLTGVKGGGWSQDRCCSICDLGRSWPRRR